MVINILFNTEYHLTNGYHNRIWMLRFVTKLYVRKIVKNSFPRRKIYQEKI